jgi:2-oxoglutarate dehydrogenase E1 component
LDAEYQRYLAQPESVPDDLRQFFAGFDLANANGARIAGAPAMATGASAGTPSEDSPAGKARRVIEAYRDLGHLCAKIDPFGRERARPAALALGALGLRESDLAATVPGLDGASTTLRDLIARLEATYCGPIGAEFMHIPVEAERAWFVQRFDQGRGALAREEQLRLLEQLTGPEQFEKFLGVRYQGKKRFSLEGGESLIPLLKAMTQRAGELGTQEIILGMPHRGRLSVLRNFLGKDLHKLFTEFEDAWTEGQSSGGGDVKYHRGYSGDQPLEGPGLSGKVVHLSMLNNPSHLESVDPVVMGKCRAKQDILGDRERRRVISVLLHGDAAVIGQGVVGECLNMSQLEGYEVGGTIHVVVNNLVGFTTDPQDGRSTPYCTDVGKIVNTPVLHVNGDDPEAVVWAAKVAADYRHEFRKDVFVDLVCFRRYGHNEQDEPRFTQPALYASVGKHPGTPQAYRANLVRTGAVTQAQADAIVDKAWNELDAGQAAARGAPVNPVPAPGGGQWSGMQGKYTFESPRTAVDASVVAEVCAAMGRTPPGFAVFSRVKPLLATRAALPQAKKLSHADAELIAFGTLLLDGHPVRLSGQDCRRGTFSQRHAVLRDESTDERYTPLNHVRPGKQSHLSVWDSPLSEFGVMGFDYGYARAYPKCLVLWEGQFGDFCNGAQVMIDQWLAASEVKWHRWAGLVLLLPHGYEGQGPEHSSARLERFLQLCADDNMEVAYPTTGAQMFHLLRRQALRNFRKPLIVMTPKKYLRVETSLIDELSAGSFQHIIDDSRAAGSAAKDVTRVVYCSGKVFHELGEKRDAAGRKDVAIVRIEQLYPFHASLAASIDQRYPRTAKRLWVQEEPRNQGAYMYIADRFREDLGVELAYVGRPASASPASGSEHAHHHQQAAILARALGLEEVAPASANAKVGAKR